MGEDDDIRFSVIRSGTNTNKYGVWDFDFEPSCTGGKGVWEKVIHQQNFYYCYGFGFEKKII